VPLGIFQQYLAANRKYSELWSSDAVPFTKRGRNQGMRKFLSDAKLDPTDGEGEATSRIPVVGSGHVAFSPQLFREGTASIATTCARPPPDEIDWSLRLRQQKFRTTSRRNIVADHCQPVDLKTICNQHYKHSIGRRGGYVLCPGALDIPVVATTCGARTRSSSGFAQPS